MAASVLAIVGYASAKAEAPPPSRPRIPITEALGQVRHQLVVDATGGLKGDGANVLREAIAPARFVAIGEDHFTHEIPLFVSSLCDEIAPDLSALALEVGPDVLSVVQPSLRSPDREAHMRDFFRLHPNSIAFLDSRDDNAMAAHCADVSKRRDFRIIGADQEFVASTTVLLNEILKTPLSKRARGTIEQLRDRARASDEQAKATGDPSKLFLLSSMPQEWEDAAEALRSGGNPEARRLLADLRESRDIYALNSSPTPQLSNERRARLLKHNLLVRLPSSGKVILKFGDWHLYKGINPLHQRDLGNFAAEYADMNGQRSVHILVLGAKGVHSLVSGYARPPTLQPFVMSDDRDYHWFKSAAEQQVAAGWTLFDLRALRFARIDMDADWRRVVDGYDLMIVIPELSPSETLVADSP